MTTQHVFASYQEIIDLHTESDRVSILGFHTPANKEPINMLKPFWEAYQKVRYRGCSMSMVPAARLPADPSQVSYGAGSPPIDPRDLLNPILFHGCHGNDMSAILNQFYSGELSSNEIDRAFSDSMDHNLVRSLALGNAELYESLYYRALTDNTWLKAHPQRGFRKTMRPKVYTLATNTPMNPGPYGARRGNVVQPAPTDGLGVDQGVRTSNTAGVLGGPTSSSTNSLLTTGAPGLQTANSGATEVTNTVGYTGQFFMSPSLRPLGWIDTRQWTTGYANTASVTSSVTPGNAVSIGEMYQKDDEQAYVTIPKVFMGMCLLPPAYKTEQYFRIVINHSFEFAKYRGTSMRPNGYKALAGNVVNMYNAGTSKGVDDDGFGDKGILDD